MEMTTRFACVSEEELNLLLENKDAKNTKRATKSSVKIFKEYLREKSLEEPEDKRSLAVVLKSFYAEARKSDGTSYSKGSLNCLRFGLNRHFKSVQGFDIINDSLFTGANKVFLAKCVDLKRQGLAKVEHKPPILECDIKKLYECGVFGLDEPRTLQNKVFFEIVLYFCRHGRQNLRELKITDFLFGRDEKGSRYVCQAGNELQRSRSEDDVEHEVQIMHEKPGPICPVGSLELYITHLNPDNHFLFQKPKKNARIGVDDICYDNMAIGARMLGDKMKAISREAELSKIYTNHSIRATSVSKLDMFGLDLPRVMAAGVKSETNVEVSEPIVTVSLGTSPKAEASADAISDLESQLAQTKQALQDAEYQRQKQVREMESTGQQDKMSLEHLYDKKFRSLQAEMDQQDIEQQKRVRKLEDQVKERDEKISQITEAQKQQAQQAERALEDFKNQVEKNSARMFDEMKTQMEKVEEDLAYSKSLREKQSREYSRQIDDIKMKHDKQIAELKISHEQDKAQMLRSHQAERDCILREQEQERDLQSEKLHHKMMDMENQSRDKSTKDAKVNAELEQQVRELREEIMQANSLHKTQLMELNLLREEEKQAFKRQEENLQAKMRSELEQQKLELRRAHSAEMEQLLEKTNERLRMMEQEFTSRSEKAQEANRTLDEEIKKLREDNLRTRLNSEKKLSELTNKFNEEKAALKKHRDSIVGSLEQDSQAQKSMVRHLEKRCQQMELESQEKISRLRLKYEEKMKGLMPESVREELEDTIESLRQQVSVLQSRAQVLQEELDTRNKFSMSSFNVSSYKDESDRQAV